MRSLHAVSLTQNVLAWLVNSSQRRILHVFESACNLINGDKEILSVVTSRTGNGPFNLVVDGEMPFPQYIHANSVVSILNRQLTLGELTIDTGNAELWNPGPNWGGLHANRESILAQLISLPIEHYQPILPDSLMVGLSSAMVNSDIPSAQLITSRLAGLGAGLTPAGDDFILGSLLATWIIHPPESARVLAKEVADTAGPLTTSLSAAWLRSAGRGEAGILWHEFFNVLLSTDSAGIQNAMDEILAVGETSGSDAMAGFMDSFVYWGQHRSNL
jgi:hypothetical protein